MPAKPQDTSDFLKDLLRLPGLSGHEGPVSARIQQSWEPLADEVHRSRLGSLHAVKWGSGEAERPSLMLAAHMDAIGLMVKEIVEGFLRVTEVGGLDPRILPGQRVTVHGRRDLPGVVAAPPGNLLPENERGGHLRLGHLLVDTGLSPRELAAQVRPGDLISFAQEPFELGENLVSGHSLDNRASVAALTVCLQELQDRTHAWDVIAVATTQEEETFGGALTSTFGLRPTVGIAVDTTFGTGPGVSELKGFPIGEGPVNGWGPNIHPGVFKELKAAAGRIELSLKDEVMPGHSGTDAVAIQITAEGIPTALVSIPVRYLHTPVEVVSLTDIQRTGRILAEFAIGLSPDFAAALIWD